VLVTERAGGRVDIDHGHGSLPFSSGRAYEMRRASCVRDFTSSDLLLP
jgi:hypothetical protein